MANMSGGAVIARMLKAEGVEVAFGIVDGSYLGLCAGLRDQEIALVTPRHETCGCHMAGNYARLSGKLGVVLASNGPGVANVLSGVAVEQEEGNRVLLLTSCRRVGIHYPNRGATFQSFNQVGVIKQMSKWSEAVPSFDRIAELMRKALKKCWEGRPGVVHLDIPENILNGKDEAPPFWEPHQYRRTEPLYPNPADVKKAARMLADARLPLIHAGGGVIHAGAFEELKVVAELLHAPVTTSWSGRSCFSENHPLCWPMVQVKPNNEVRNAADLVLCLGARLGETDWWGKAPYWAQPQDQKMIQVDLDDEVLGRIRPIEVGVQADIKVFLRLLADELDSLKSTMPIKAREDEVKRLAEGRTKDRLSLDSKLEDRATPMLTAHIGRTCQEVLEKGAVLVFDGGNTSVWGQFYYQATTPNSVLATHHMGHLGAGVGQAIGAAIARPDKQVVCIIGDGAFGMHPQEIETAVRHDLHNIVFIVAADKQWGMVKMTQSIAFKPLKMMLKKQLPDEDTINSGFGEIEYDQLALAMGGHGERVADPNELAAALKRCLASDKPSVIHADVDSKKHLWAPALLHFKAMHQEPKGK
ncbi:MAG: thiamine pyrophosphate-binding protein [Deltaproteobacteria bacterium RIFOXYB12_FULL_58_9]|nr:MAG: thiamine pyrophosphate-binding protein [Deltaproteobacteria bacterium RIFOXYB12_FULL_58_9]